jgi:Na+-translocating ferredoxin:NAD+ oxidoreductase subunit D
MKKTGWIVSPSPFILTRPTVTKMSLVTIASLVPQIGLIALDGDYGALLNILSAIAGSLVAEVAIGFPARKPIAADLTVFITGALIGMFLPCTFNPVLAGFVAFIGVLFGKALFGGRGSFWVHPVAIAVCVGYVSQAAAFPTTLVTADGLKAVGDAFGALKLDRFSQLAQDQAVTGTLNSGLLGNLGIRLPEGYFTLLWNSPSAIPAFRYNALTLLSSIVLLSMEVIDWIIPFFFLATYGICVWFLSLFPFTATFSGGDILFAFLTSGTLFAAFYVLPEYSTSPRTRLGKGISGIVGGAAAFLNCGPGGSPVGILFAILIANSINPLIEHYENRTHIISGEQA